MEKQKDRKYEENGKLLEDIIKLPEKNEREESKVDICKGNFIWSFIIALEKIPHNSRSLNIFRISF